MVSPTIALCGLIFTLGFTGIASQDKPEDKEIEVVEKNDELRLECPYKICVWRKDGEFFKNSEDGILNLGSVWNDPRGTYSCKGGEKPEKVIDVFVRKCKNCIEMDAATISGFVIADLIMIGLIAMAVYFVSGSETRRPGRASDKQNLIDVDQEYQQLGHRNDDYSKLNTRTKRNAI